MKRAFFTFVILSLMAAAGLAQSKTVDAPQAARPLSVGIVVDNSGSYRTIFDRVLNAAKAVIDEMPAGDEGFLLTFVDAPKIKLRQEMTSDKSDLLDAAENMFIEGGSTAILDAVVYASKYMAQQAASGEGRTRVLLLITDGDERESSATIDDAIKAAKDAGIKIYVLGLHEEKFYAKIPDRLTRETGGSKFVPKTHRDTQSATASLLSAIRAK